MHKVRNRVVFLLLCVQWLRLTRTAVQFSLTKSLTLSFARTEDSNLHVLQTTCKVASRVGMRYQHEAALACALWKCCFIKIRVQLDFPMPHSAKKCVTVSGED